MRHGGIIHGEGGGVKSLYFEFFDKTFLFDGKSIKEGKDRIKKKRRGEGRETKGII